MRRDLIAASALAAAVAAGADDARAGERAVLREAEVRVEVVDGLARALGVVVRADGPTQEGRSEVLRAAEGSLVLDEDGGDVEGFYEGGLELSRPIEVSTAGGERSWSASRLVVHSRSIDLDVRDADGERLFVVGYPHVRYDPSTGEISIRNADVRLSAELAEALGNPAYAGLVIATLEAHGLADSGARSPQGGCESDFTLPGDVELTGIAHLQMRARSSGVVTLAPSAELRNAGPGDVPWYEAFHPGPEGHDQHPFLVWNLFRTSGGRLDQVGRSTAKHAFFAVNSGCACFGANVLFAGCSDFYGVTTNDDTRYLAPRTEITSHTGDWEKCFSHWDEDCDGTRDHESEGHDAFSHRMVVDEGDLATAGARYFIEAWYVAKDDPALRNSLGWREVEPSFDGSVWTFAFLSGLAHGPGIEAWTAFAAAAPDALHRQVSSAEGAIAVGSRSTDLGGGRHRVDVAVQNLTFDRRLSSFAVPTPAGAAPANLEFSDADTNPANDWLASSDASGVRWEAPLSSAALDWGTLARFSFEVNGPLGLVQAASAAVEPGAGAHSRFDVLGAGGSPVFVRDTVGLRNADTGAFFVRNASAPGIADAAARFGPSSPGWVPLAGDWNGDGRAGVGLYDRTNGAVHLKNDVSSGAAAIAYLFGPAGSSWTPVVGDWDGDGDDDVGLYDPEASVFHLRLSHTSGSADVAFSYGPPGGGLTPIAGDWDGNGVDTPGLVATDGTWFLRNANAAGPADVVFGFGAGGSDVEPLAGDWNGDGTTTAGIRSRSSSAVFVRNAHASGPADSVYVFGAADPAVSAVVADWDGL